MKLKEYLKDLNSLVKKYPKLNDVIVIYARDDEGNGYQEVVNSPAFLQVHDINERDLEVVGFMNEANIAIEDINAIIIN
jgi:hypothetical protein